MRIALVILHADPARGGAERYTVDLAAGLAGRGHDVSLLAGSFGPSDPPPGVRHVPLPMTGATRSRRYLNFVAALDRHVGAERYDVVHAMFPVPACDVYHPHAGLAAEAVARGHLKYDGPVRRRMAQLGTRLNPRRMLFARVERRLLTSDRPPVVLCLSESIKSTVRRHYPLPEDRLATLFNAVDLTRFDPAARPAARDETRRRYGFAPDDVVALIIAQDFARKGLAEAIRAVAPSSIPDARLKLLVVGKDDPRRYRALAESLHAAGRVVFAGPTNDPYACYRAADLFVLSTRHDPCSLVVLEALAMGLPVISTVFNGACEIMQPTRHGFVLPDPADVPALAGAIRQLLDPGRRDAMAAECLALRPELAYGRHLDRLLAIYEGACHEGIADHGGNRSATQPNARGMDP